MPELGSCNRVLRVVERFGREFLMQRELLQKRFAQFGVVIDDHNRTSIGHEASEPVDVSAGAELAIKPLPSKGLTLHAFV
jgi:hypothetical protein